MYNFLIFIVSILVLSLFQSTFLHIKNSVDKIHVQNIKEKILKGEKFYVNFEFMGNNLTKGNELFKKGDYVGAIREYSKELECRPSNAQCLFNRGASFMKVENFRNAILDFTAFLSITPNDSSALYNRGMCYFRVENYKKSINDFTRSINFERKPLTLYSCYFHRGLCFQSVGDVKSSLEDFSMSIILNNRSINAFFRRAYLLYNLMKYPKAIEDFDYILKINSEKENIISAIRGKGMCYFMIGEYSKALNCFTKVIEICEDVQEIIQMRCRVGECFQKLEEYEKAVFQFIEAAKISPNDLNIQYSAAKCYFELGRYLLAEQFFSKSISLDPSYTLAFYYRGLGFYHQQKYNRAIYDFTVTIGRNCIDEKILWSVYKYRGICRFHSSSMIFSAIDDFSCSIKLESENSRSYFFRSLCFEKVGNFEEAISDIEKSISIEKNPYCFVKLGEFLELIGDDSKALKIYSECVRLCSKKDDDEMKKNLVFSIHHRAMIQYKRKEYGFHISDFLRLRELMSKPFTSNFILENEEISILIEEVEKLVDVFMKKMEVDIIGEYVKRCNLIAIGSGLYSTVYKVSQHVNNLDLFFAAKVFNQSDEKELEKKKNEEQTSLRKRSFAEEEALFLFSLNHPNIVKCFGWDHTGILLEYGNGGTVIKYIQNSSSPISLELKLKWLFQVASAMNYLHSECEIVHRDLKWENVILQENKKDFTFDAKLIDFGFAKDFGVVRSNIKSELGSNFYVAPEICLKMEIFLSAMRNGSFSRKIDVFSFGVMFYVLYYEIGSYSSLNKRFYSSPIELLDETWTPIFEEIENPSENHGKIVGLMKKCLKINPKDRPDFKEILEILRETRKCYGKCQLVT